jgi:hypothetical protein
MAMLGLLLADSCGFLAGCHGDFNNEITASSVTTHGAFKRWSKTTEYQGMQLLCCSREDSKRKGQTSLA